MEIVTAMIGPVVESLMVPVKKHVGYVVFTTRHVREMGTRMRHLDGIRVDVNKHMVENNESILEVPALVPIWLDKVKKIKDEVETISTIGRGCFNLKMRHKAGRKASKITLEIERLIKENSEIIWANHQIPLGKVISSSGGATQNDFRSRDQTFKEALEFLHPKHKTQIIALCGMSGVGKTTMMEQLQKAVGTFYLVVKAVVGEMTDPIAIQQAIADYMSEPLTESTKTARADRLCLRFKEISKEGQNKVMVMLDDLWEMVDLNDIGLSPLPNGFKVLLTSRNEKFCTLTAEEANSTVRVIRVDVLKEPEAHDFFCQIAGVSEKTDLELNQIGLDIVKKCGFLPLAIRLIATTLKNEDKFAWSDALNRLEMNDLEGNVRKIIEMSYDYLKRDEAKTILLLCGLFPDDFDIPVEELTRYAWGLKVLGGVPTLRSARNMTKTCVRDLQNANLLIASDRSGCVKMHDLVLSFVLGVVSKGEHAWIINHGGVSKWSTSEMRERCKSISLTCTGIYEFPEDFKYPNLSLLKLIHGDRSLRFPRDFFKSMEKIEVIAFEKMHYRLLPRSLQCSTNLRTLCLYKCLLVHDISPIGNLLNLEVLSFAHCRIQKLPSAIENLKRLKLLDLTGSFNLHIDDGVLQNLVELEELYMRVAKVKSRFSDNEPINLTDANYNELIERSKNLSVIEIEFFGNMDLPKNMFWKKLERFRISMGCYFKENEGDNVHSFENTLKLCTNTGEILESKINELFEKAEVIHLEVDGMNDLEDVLLEPMHPPRHSLFYNLRVLTVLHCVDLRHLFTPGIATCLSKLERLTISSCHAMEVLIHSDNNETIMIKFQELKFLSLGELPELVSLCNTTSVIELPKLIELRLDGLPNFSSIYPENKSTSFISIDVSAMRPFLNKEVVIPKLEKLDIRMMVNLKEIWPCRFSSSEEDIVCRLRYISVNGCDNLVNLFPSNPMPWLRHFEELRVERCGSIEVIFDLDLGCVHEIEECSSNNSLRSIVLEKLEELREVWRVKGINDSCHVIRGFQAMRIISIDECKSFRNVFTPSTANFDLGALEDIDIEGSDHLGESGKNNELVESSSSINTNTFGQQGITRMSHVLQFNWNIFLVPQQQESIFYNLTRISLRSCNNVKYLLSVKLLSNLKTISISEYDSTEEVVSNSDNGDEEITTSTSTQKNAYFFPYVDTLELRDLPCLKHIGGGNNVITSNVTTNATVVHDPLQHAHVAVGSWSLCQYAKRIDISKCYVLSSVIPSYAVGQLQKLEELRVDYCESMLELFGSQKINNCGDNSNNIGEGSFGTSTLLAIPIPRMKTKPLVELCNLRILAIGSCAHLRYIFTCSTLESLKQLKELNIYNCTSMKVIVKEEDGEQTTTSKVVVLPRLQSIRLEYLPNLEGFFLGKTDFQWQSLDKVKIINCPQMTLFTSGHSRTPKLDHIHTRFGKYSLAHGLNSHFTTTTLQETQSSSSGGSSSFLTSKGIPLSFSNLIEVDAPSISELRNIIPFDELLQMQKLEKINVANCDEVVEVFEAFKGENSGLNESQSVVKFPELREVYLSSLGKLEYIWRNDRWTILEFPNLTSLSILYCYLFGHVFTCSMVDSLPKLQELKIWGCDNVEVIVKEEEEENRGKGVVFPCLKSLQLVFLKKLKGFCLGKADFLWPSLRTLEIKDCPEITTFTNGLLTTPELKLMDTSTGLFYEEGINAFIKVKKQEGFEI